MNEVRAIPVFQLARRIRNLLEIEVGELWVEGEISNLRKQASGHWYFALKDDSAQISCAMFGARRRAGNEVLRDGEKVQVFGEVSFYEARGSTQLIVRKARAVGKGDLHARFEALKKKLKDEGLFDPELRRSLPVFPRTIGLVTSPTGAALQDLLSVLSRRAPWLEVVLFPTAVQGKGAERHIVKAIQHANRVDGSSEPKPEVLIVGRGGGSLEDLWNFNEEVVARAIAASEIPVVSAVGHETDFTISDFVADMRAPTPSAAAELVAPDRKELQERLENVERRLRRTVTREMEHRFEQLDYLSRGILGRNPERILSRHEDRLERARADLLRVANGALENRSRVVERHAANWARFHPRAVLTRREEKLKYSQEKFLRAARVRIDAYESKLAKTEELLNALGPHNVLRRGFSITFDSQGNVIRDAESLNDGDQLLTQLACGKLTSIVSSNGEES